MLLTPPFVLVSLPPVGFMVQSALPAQTLQEVQKLHGKLLHASLVFLSGRAYLINLEAMLGIFQENPFMPRTPPRHTSDDVKWWKATLATVPLPSIPIPNLQPVLDFRAYSDTCSRIGIGITIW